MIGEFSASCFQFHVKRVQIGKKICLTYINDKRAKNTPKATQTHAAPKNGLKLRCRIMHENVFAGSAVEILGLEQQIERKKFLWAYQSVVERF